MQITKTFTFEAAHRLRFHEGKCACLHGHSYTVTVSVEGNIKDQEGPDKGMVLDYGVLKRICAPVIDNWDHATILAESDVQAVTAVSTVLNSKGESKIFLLPVEPTAENMAQYLASIFAPAFFKLKMELLTVTVCETATTSASHTIVLF